MSKTNRIFTFLLAAILLISSLALPSNASLESDAETISPRWTNAGDLSITLKKVNGKIQIKIEVTGYTGTTFSSGEVALLKTSGTNTGLVKSWDRLYSNSRTFTFTDNSVTATSGTYKVNFSIKALRNGVGETISGTATLTV